MHWTTERLAITSELATLTMKHRADMTYNRPRTFQSVTVTLATCFDLLLHAVRGYFWFLRQATLAGGDIPFFFRLLYTKVVNTMFWKRINRFWCKLAFMRFHDDALNKSTFYFTFLLMVHGQGHEMVNSGGQEVKDQDDKRPKIDLEVWWRSHSHSWSLGSSRFSRYCTRIFVEMWGTLHKEWRDTACVILRLLTAM